MWDLGRFLSPHFDGRIKDASHCCKICATSDDKWSTSSSCSSLSEFAWSLRKWWRILVKDHNRWWVMGLRLWRGNKGPAFTVDEQNIPQTQKSSPSSIQNQGAAHSFFDTSGVVHHEYLPEGSTVNQTYYIEVLKGLRDAIWRKRPELWRSGDWFFHHDNAPAHSALRTREFLAKHSITVLPHPPYSPDLAPCDFF